MSFLLLLISQDLLSFELLDINIVQELESVPNNTPAGEETSASYCCSVQEQNYTNTASLPQPY